MHLPSGRRETIALDYGELPTPERAAAILARWQETLDGAIARDARDWEIRVAKKYESWARALEAAVAEGHPTCDLTSRRCG